jgi:diacylglycerol kinase family enzyme
VDSSATTQVIPPAAVQRQPIILLLNTGSGSCEKNEARQRIVETIEAAGREVTVIELAPPARIPALIEEAAVLAKARGAILVAAGGDGTLNTVAKECCLHQLTMGMIPLGTFNYFARGMGIPLDTVEATKVLLNGGLRTTDVGYVNNFLFINNASFGVYSRVIRNREQDKLRFGRFRVVALLSAAKTLFRGLRPFDIRIVAANGVHARRTELVYVCNNPFQLESLGLPLTDCLVQGRLAVLVLKPLRILDTLRLLWRGLMRNLDEETRLEKFCAGAFHVDTRRRSVDVVVDGEVVRCATPLSFRVARQALRVIVPGEVQQ